MVTIHNRERLNPCKPTDAGVGSDAKIEVLRARFLAGEELHHPDDNPRCDRLPNYCRRNAGVAFTDQGRPARDRSERVVRYSSECGAAPQSESSL